MNISAMELERAPYIPVWKDLAENFSPTRQRFQIVNGKKANRSNSNIIDSTPTFAKNTLRAGMTGGITSPARPWFRLTTQDPELAEFGAVKNWLWEVQEIMYATFRRSNLYGSFPNMFGDGGVYGTSPMGIFEVFNDNLFHTDVYQVGSYCLAQDEYGRVNGFSRRYRMTVQQLVSRFGRFVGNDFDWSNISRRVRDQFERGNYQTWVDVVMWAGPNADFIPGSPWSVNKPFVACYFEAGCAGSPTYSRDEAEVMLEEKGYDFFPVLGLRWEKSDDEVYASDCPGMSTIGDAKQLQLVERRILEAAEKKLRPPMQAPSSLRGKGDLFQPDSTIFMDIREGMQGVKSLYEVDFNTQEWELKQNQVRNRIREGFYADLFLMLSNMEDRQRTAYEVAERKEEKLLALGPVLEQANGDVLDPLIDITFYMHMKRRLFPPIPDELRGQAIKIEYTSVTAQAQKLIGIATVDRFVQSVGMIAGFDPRVVRKLKTDQIVDGYADMLSVNPSFVRTEEEVQAIDAAEAQQVQQQNQMAMIESGAKTAQALANTNTTGNNALNNLMAMASAGQ